MVLVSKGLVSRADLLQKRLADNPETQEAFDTSLHDVVHYKVLVQATLKGHERMKKYWKEFVIDQKDTEISAEIVPGSKLPALGHMKSFIRWLGLSLQGRLRDYISRRTLDIYVQTFFALWPRYATIAIPKEFRLQVLAYSKSQSLRDIAPTTTAIRPKNVADTVDIKILLRAFYTDRKNFRTHRMRIQMAATIILSAISSERPGAIVESGGYRHSNQCIQWRDFTFLVIPSQEHPHKPWIVVIVRVRLLKGWRDDASREKLFFLYPEEDDNRASCPVTAFLYLALEDEIFTDIVTIEDLLFPIHNPTQTHELSIKDSKRGLAVFRAEVKTDSGWTISNHLALPYVIYLKFLRVFSLDTGFEAPILPYCLRRHAANNFSSELSEDDRLLLMGHTPGSLQFIHSYQTRLSYVDIQGIHNNRGQSTEKTSTFKSASRMSRTLDPNAPVKLTLQGRQELYAEPELVQMRQERKKLLVEAQMVDVDLEEEEDILAALQTVSDLRKQAARIQQKHDVIVLRETRTLVENSRSNFFKDASGRQLRGETSAPVITPMAANSIANIARRHIPLPLQPTGSTFALVIGKEKQPISNVIATSASHKENIPAIVSEQQSAVYSADTLDPISELNAALYEFSSEERHLQLAAVVNAMLGLPECPFALCYPGESPTRENKCPVCGETCNTTAMQRADGGTGPHIHACIRQKLRAEAQAMAEEQYTPDVCKWDRCSRPAKIWQTRKDFLTHLHLHIQTLDLLPSRIIPVRACKWQLSPGLPCNESDCEDWNEHFAEVHSINTQLQIKVHYCIMCAQWFSDHFGDGRQWEEHSLDHFNELFAPFVERVGSVDHTPLGIIFTSKFDNCIEFEHGTGFGGKQPEFHGHTQNGVCFTPMFCPWCVWDESLIMQVRMRQYPTELFVRHLKGHENAIDTDDLGCCPVPSCGTRKFNRFDLLFHMVVLHRVPICGSTSHTVVRRLRLPSPEDDHDEDSSCSLSSAQPSRSVLPSSSSPEILGKKRRRDDAVEASGMERAWCWGCSRPYDDIHGHIGAATDDKRCRTFAKYTKMDGDKRIGPRLKWNPSPDNPAQSSRSRRDRPHRCETCRRQFHDIREHIPSACNATRFKIRDPSVPRSQFGPWHNFATWSATAPPLPPSQSHPPSS